MTLKDEIQEMYYGYICENGKEPNVLRIPQRHLDEFDDMVNSLAIYDMTPDIKAKTKHWWYMGMRVFRERWSFCVGWSEEKEKIKAGLP